MSGSLLSQMRDYVLRMLTEVTGMKALVLDPETTKMVSLVLTQSQILEKEVFLVRKIGASTTEKAEELHHLRAVVFIRPTERSISDLENLIKARTFAEVFVFFSNTTRIDILQRIANADELDIVKGIHEYYGDVYAINPDLFSLEIPQISSLYKGAPYDPTDSAKFNRIVDGVFASVLNTGSLPVIRYHANKSGLAKDVAAAVAKRVEEFSSLFEGKEADTWLLVLDRRDDPVTPLLQQWTYQAMVHELFSIVDNTVDLSAQLDKASLKPVAIEDKKFVLSPELDNFFKGSMYLNFGDLCVETAKLLENFQKTKKITSEIQSIADMRAVIDRYPDLMSESAVMRKHFTITSEMTSVVDSRRLLKVSKVEQGLACDDDLKTAVSEVSDVLDDSSINFDDKLRVVMLFSLRYESSREQISIFSDTLRRLAGSDEGAVLRVRRIQDLLKFAGASSRGGDVFSRKDWVEVTTKFLTSGLKDVDNVFTQHQPYLAKILDLALKSKLKDTDFPSITGSIPKKTPKEVIVFVVGGATYEEAAYIASFNSKSSTVKVTLGGTDIVNSKMFLADVPSFSTF